MKAIIIFGLSVLFCLNTVAQETKEIPLLAIETIKGKLQRQNFSDTGKYFINIDTVTTANAGLTFVYKTYNTKDEIIDAVKRSIVFLEDAETISFRELRDNFLYEYKKHWIMKVRYQQRDYIIQWWFASDDKIEGLTLSL